MPLGELWWIATIGPDRLKEILKLDLKLGSPQFQVQFENFFDTARPYSDNPPKFSQWQILSELKNRPLKGNIHSEGAREDPEPFLPS